MEVELELIIKVNGTPESWEYKIEDGKDDHFCGVVSLALHNLYKKGVDYLDKECR